MKSLFDQTQISDMKMKNRLIRAAVGDRYAINGRPTEKDLAVYETLAKGGIGTIITGFTYVTGLPLSPDMFGITDDSAIPDFKKLTDVVHRYGVNIILQLVHCGSYTAGIPGTRVPGPSAMENLNTKITPYEMTREDIRDVQQAFSDAAVRAKEAGFDGIELHAAHGFLLNQFLTPYYNRRKDEYGGSDENRASMLMETYRQIRNKVGCEFPILAKINCDDGIENGITFEGFRTACNLLGDAGIDAIEVSGPWMRFHPKDEFYFKESAEKAAASGKTPFILTGGNRDFDAMMRVLNETPIEYFGLCRPLIAEPTLVKRWENGNTRRTKCISCNGCTHQGQELKCTVNG
jgi:2,4-dienoyl-CoA reductase-like NADH-dependent reductase (Old Yellow Enzyme family)